MISRKEKLLWLCYGVVLVFLFLLSSTDWLIKERENQVYPISVVVEDDGDDNYKNFLRGVEQAATELNADVSFITLYQANDQQEQIELMIREQQAGARAIIVAPVEVKALEEALAEKRVTVPLVLVNGELPRDKVLALVTVDCHEMGRRLAAQIMQCYGSDTPVYLFGPNRKNEVVHRFEDGVAGTLSEAGYSVIRFHRTGEDSFRNAIEDMVYPGSHSAVIVALDQNSLLETAKILEDRDVYSAHVKGLYGRGTTIPILNYLDRGIITGICVTDDFSAGYLSIKRAVEVLTNQAVQDQTILESYYIEKEDLRRAEYEKMLYPIE